MDSGSVSFWENIHDRNNGCVTSSLLAPYFWRITRKPQATSSSKLLIFEESGSRKMKQYKWSCNWLILSSSVRLHHLSFDSQNFFLINFADFLKRKRTQELTIENYGSCLRISRAMLSGRVLECIYSLGNFREGKRHVNRRWETVAITANSHDHATVWLASEQRQKPIFHHTVEHAANSRICDELPPSWNPQPITGTKNMEINRFDRTVTDAAAGRRTAHRQL